MEWGNLFGLNDLLWRQELLQILTHLDGGSEVLRRDQPAKLVRQVSDRLQVWDFPVEEPTQVGKIAKIKLEQFTI